MQNGTLMHTLSGENRLKPRHYEDPSGPRIENADLTVEGLNLRPNESPKGGAAASTPNVFDHLDDQSLSDEEIVTIQRRYTTPAELTKRHEEQKFPRNWATDTDMKKENRSTLPNFNSLQYNGTTMNEATIGGFRLDIQTAQKRVVEFIPLPPVCLPIIFMDKDLNFSHHFFQGLDVLLGKKYMEKIVSQEKYSENDSRRILPSLKALIMSGAKNDDTELTMFVKRVLSGTFDTLPEAAINSEQDELIVAVNMWGFQYLEPSMRCRDEDLRMWLHMSFMQYKVSWFNTFKSSGVPKFALDGVQGRYESKGEEQWKSINMERELKVTPRIFKSREEGSRRSRSYRDDRQIARYEGSSSMKTTSVLGKFFS
jgi:hypothetical protein